MDATPNKDMPPLKENSPDIEAVDLAATIAALDTATT